MSATVQDQFDTDVLVVGAGPVGLALAAELGRRGVGVTVIDRRPNRPVPPKMIIVGMRTLEFCRQLGIHEQVHNWGWPADHSMDSLFCTSMQGHELGRVVTPSLADSQHGPHSPERDMPCPQRWFDPILREYVDGLTSVSISHETELTDIRQDENGVTVSVKALGSSTPRRQVRARYLVGCDGASSTVRSLMSIGLRGDVLDQSMSIYLYIKDLDKYHSLGMAYRYVFVQPDGVWGGLTTMDGRDYYRLQLIGNERRDVRGLDPDATVRAFLGDDVPYKIEQSVAWERRMTVADRYADGRVLIAGDAAHAHPPNGGLGMNTGIVDAWNLGWKIAAITKGWGGEQLLASYDTERRPVGWEAAAESLRNYHRLTGEGEYGEELLAATPEGKAVRASVGESLVGSNKSAWHPLGVHIGYDYSPSEVIVDDGTLREPVDPAGYVPSARPGRRAPHAWLPDGRSTLDLFGDGLVLLALGVQADSLTAAGFAAAAEAMGAPLSVELVQDEEIAELYAARYVLVRPDGHVAWRSSEEIDAAQARTLLATVLGHGARIAGCRT